MRSRPFANVQQLARYIHTQRQLPRSFPLQREILSVLRDCKTTDGGKLRSWDEMDAWDWYRVTTFRRSEEDLVYDNMRLYQQVEGRYTSQNGQNDLSDYRRQYGDIDETAWERDSAWRSVYI